MQGSKRIIRNRWFYFIQIILDVAIVDVSYYLGFKLQRPDLFVSFMPANILITLLYISVISFIFFLAFKLHKCGQKPYSLTIFYLLVALPMIAFMAVIIDFIIKGIGLWRRTIFYAVVIQIPAFLLVKFLVYKLYHLIIKPKECVIIGKTVLDAAKLFLKLHTKKNTTYRIGCILGEDNENLKEHIRKNQQIIICSSCTNKTDIMEYCAVNNKDCMIVPSFSDILVHSGKFDNINDVMVYDMKIKMDAETKLIKRFFDIIAAAIALIILSPVILIVSIAIKASDKGKIIYSQNRLTRGNREFKLYKFRTMIENAEDKTGPVLAKADDQRITNPGKFLRASRLDEIPQLFNVLKGEMSIVGPRPERPSLMEETVKTIPEFSYRTLVKAGVTGLAQTLGRYNTEFKDKVRFDLYYVNNYSLLLDLKILFYTFHTLFTPSVAGGIKENMDDEAILKAVKEKGVSIV